MTRARIGAALAVLLALAGCRTAPTLQRLPSGDPRPDRLLADWAHAVDGRTALRGTARLAVDADASGRAGRDVRWRSRQALVIARPARLRVELRGMLGDTLAVFATDGARYELFQAADRSYESGPAHDSLLWEVARIALTPADAVEVILGVPQLSDALSPSAAFDAGDGRVRIALSDAASRLRRQVEFDAEGRLRWLQERRAGAIVWEVHFDDYAPVANAPLAHRLSIETDRGGARALLTLSDVELNPELSPSIFRIEALATGAPHAAGGD